MNMIPPHRLATKHKILNDYYATMLASYLSSPASTGNCGMKPSEILTMFLAMNSSKTTYDKVSFEFENTAGNNGDDDGAVQCFITLPNGSCFGNFEPSSSNDEALQCAAKVAFVNSVYNEHSGSQINDDTIKAILHAASFSFVDILSDHNALDAFEMLLNRHRGQSMLDAQRSITVFQLLSWSGSLRELHRAGCTRDEVVAHYCESKIDDELRHHLCDDWMRRRQQQRFAGGGEAVVGTSAAAASVELARLCMERQARIREGKECRYIHEQVKVVRLGQELMLV